MTNETQTVQNYRHAARKSLISARERLALRTPETHEVYKTLNGSIEQFLRGQAGYSQQEQVDRLTAAKDALETNLATLPEKVDAARQSVLAAMENWETDLTARAQEAVTTLTEAIEFAAHRDFDAWQSSKRAQYESYVDTEDEVTEDDEDEIF